MKFFNLSPTQLQVFSNLKSSEELQHHGPLAAGERVPGHTHQSKALYLTTTGAAVCVTNKHDQDTLLGFGQQYNAVLVEAGEQHGWIATMRNTLIEHCFDRTCDDVLLA